VEGAGQDGACYGVFVMDRVVEAGGESGWPDVAQDCGRFIDRGVPSE
jgi:hypothetical protein